MRRSEIELDLGGETLTCTVAEVAAAFAALLREMRAALPFLGPDERAALRHIMAHECGTRTVAEVFPDFTRDGPAHVALRRLRTAQFIIPVGRDRWERDQHIAIKPFARLVWDQLGEAALFGEAPIQPDVAAEVGEAPVQTPAVAPTADFGAAPPVPTADAVAAEPTPPTADALSAKNTTISWEDDDVFDFLNDAPG